MEKLSEHRAFEGTVGFYRHRSDVNNCDMQFSVFIPPKTDAPVPVLTWLSGLTCTEETFMVKAGAQRIAAELGLSQSFVSRLIRQTLQSAREHLEGSDPTDDDALPTG